MAADEVMGELQGMMSRLTSLQMVTDVVHAYDAYATAAMNALVRSTSTNPAVSAELVAATAWNLADAMMTERKKRGIGGFSPTVADAFATGVQVGVVGPQDNSKTDG